MTESVDDFAEVYSKKAFEEERIVLARALREVIAQAVGADITLMIHSPTRLGVDITQNAREAIAVVELIKRLHGIDTKSLSTPILRQLSHSVEQLWIPLGAILYEKFEPSRSKRDQVVELIQSFKKKYDELFERAAQYSETAYSAWKASQFESERSRLIAEWEDLRLQTQKARLTFEEAEKFSEERAKTSELVESLRDQIGRNQIADEMRIFAAAALKYSKQAIWWGIAGGLSFALLVFLYYSNFNDAFVNADGGLVMFFTKKLVFIVFAASPVVWFLRMYRISKHLQAVNEHRARAFQSFQYFMSALPNSDSSQRVLLEAAQAVFRPTPSGYFVKESPPISVSLTDLLKFDK